MSNVISFKKSKDKEVEKIIEKIVKLPEDKFVAFLCAARNEFLGRGQEKEADLIVEVGLRTRLNRLKEMILGFKESE